MEKFSTSFLAYVSNICIVAGRVILEEYRKEGPKFSLKEDSSPVTDADLRADEIIFENLYKLENSIPYISEETTSSDENISKEIFWAVDPLDGTKEFLKKTGDFTVNIGLIKENKPIFGIVYAPVFDMIWMGYTGEESNTTNSFHNERVSQKQNPLENLKKITVSLPQNEISVVTSRSHPSVKTLQWIDQQFKGKKTKVSQRGSSIKICLIAEGKAHVYPRFGRTCIWDTAAAHAVLNGAGGFLGNIESFKELTYLENIYNAPFFASSYQLRKSQE